TSAWIDYFQNGAVSEKLDDMLSGGNVYVPMVVIAELIQGARSEKEIAVIKDFVEAFTIIDQKEDTWLEAGRLAYRLKKKGKTTNLTDCYIAIIARDSGCRILTLDKHFKEIQKEFGIMLERF
ncbi:MAG TPA: PIN domain-containing protein, partial [Thermodesulfobacteriota bacterium]|nr:PIN domain-containing protein [Thermodesulfobacteriota bacterium]